MQQIRYIAAKEVRHILRDSRSLAIAILMPLLMTLLYGYAINLDIKNIKLAVLDYDRSAESRGLAEAFFSSGYFAHPPAELDLTDPERLLKSGSAHAVLVIPTGLSRALGGGAACQLGLTLDGSDVNLAAAAASYANLILLRFLTAHNPQPLDSGAVTVEPQVLYNPDLKSSHFFVPGLIAIILMMISALLTSVTIAREKETGTMEQLLTAPVTPVEIIVGKVLPYIALAALDGLLILVFAVVHFGVPFVGSALALALFSFIYIGAALSLGILISTVSRTQQVAMMIAEMVTVLPSVMLSGFIFEIRNMPRLLQLVTYIVPARYFLLIVRGIMLKGAGLAELWLQGAFLVLLTLALLAVAARRFGLRVA